MRLYRFLRPLVVAYIRLFLRPKVSGKQNLAVSGGAIIISNHFKFHDIVIMVALFRCPIHFLGKTELFRSRLIGAFFKALGAFKVERGTADIRAVRTAVSLLKNGEVIGMYPEGTRSKDGELGAFEPGTSMFALKTDAEIVPMIIHERGYGLFKPPKVTVGEHILLSEHFGEKPGMKRMSEATALIEESMRAMKSAGFQA